MSETGFPCDRIYLSLNMFPVTVARPVLLSQRESFLQESAVGYWDDFCRLQVTASLSPPMCFANASSG